MLTQSYANDKPVHVMFLGVGAFTQGMMRILKQDGAQVSAYLTRDYAHYPPAQEGPVFLPEVHPDLPALLREQRVDMIIPMSIDWAQAPWAPALLDMAMPIFSPTGEAMRLERERDFARKLCQDFSIPFPKAFVARNRLEAERILQKHPMAFVIKNPLCSPTSPIHTILCETADDTRGWLDRIDYAEGVFLQEYLGRREAGHIALVSGGEIYSLVTNQEYKRAFTGHMGIAAGAPLGGIVERDPDDRYGLARELLHPLLPWFRQVNYHGPVQVTAALKNDRWHVLEYNIRLGVTSGPMILRLLENPLEVLWNTVRNRPLHIRFKEELQFGCSLTLAGYGYPYTQVQGPRLPVEVTASVDCDVWWNEVDRDDAGRLVMTGHRIADVVAYGATLDQALERAYANIRKIRCLGSYFRTDIGQILWPPGSE
ncbi:MAG: phosphoribosylglycinamide synthetase C domain-containing protein [candidate division KSB1 bacterium]|nr:phosphoribosylglycinamide synthetase C domain-containing protein [candidate division KSB1 bacterium]